MISYIFQSWHLELAHSVAHVCKRLFSMSVKQTLCKSGTSIFMHAHAENYGWNVGGTCGHVASNAWNFCSRRMAICGQL